MQYRQVVAELSCLAQKVLGAAKEAARSNQQFGEVAEKVLEKAGRDFWMPSLDAEQVLGSVMERYVDAVLYLFAAEIGGQVSAIMDMQGVKEACQDASKTGKLLRFYDALHELARPEDVFDREQEVAARKLAPYFSISWRKNALVFSMSAYVESYKPTYGWSTERDLAELLNALTVFMQARREHFFSRATLVQNQHIRGENVVSRAKHEVFGCGDNSIYIVTFKSKIEFVLEGELGRDFVAWMKKWAPMREAA